MTMPRVTVHAVLHRDDARDKAVRVSLSGDDRGGAWVGRKRIREMVITGLHVMGRDTCGQRRRLPRVTFSIPFWLAKETRLVR
ncbi:MAG TPA: hypothetical protein VNZ94_01845 [Xanthobacteraceae bacterium]|nr:hypothetical protein [Xanthobacteraceae bacterium]